MDLSKHDNLIYIISNIFILASCIAGIMFSVASHLKISKIKLLVDKTDDSLSPTLSPGVKSFETDEESVSIFNVSEDFKIFSVYTKIREGAFTYLRTQFLFFIPFIILCDSCLIICIGLTQNFYSGVISALCFLTGSVTSLICGILGMSIATYGNARTTISAKKSLGKAFNTSFTSAQCFGVLLPSIGILVVYSTLHLMTCIYTSDRQELYKIFSAFGLGGSIAGLFARIGGGIFTKAADVGADMVGKFEEGMKEDDPRNPAVIADNVGDNVGDIAGMGADLFGSFGEATCSAFIIIADSKTLNAFKSPQLFPLVYLALALNVGMITSLFATHIECPKRASQVEGTLKRQILIFSVAMVLVSIPACYFLLPSEFNVQGDRNDKFMAHPLNAFICLVTGIVGGALVGLVTEYYTSGSYRPVQELAESADIGPGAVVIFGLSLGGRSTFIPALILGSMMYIAYKMADSFGVVMMALGLLASTPVILTIDAYGPICDNAGGIAEMAGLGEDVRERTDALDMVGNTTAAIGKGFAISLAYIVGMALLTSFVRLSGLESVNALNAFPMLGIFIGAAFPFLFCADLNKSVGYAASKMVNEVRRQFKNPDIISGKTEPDYEECIKVATRASLIQSVFPFCITLAPILFGMLLGKKALTGFIIGVQISGVPLAISANNSGGAWDNAKKMIEGGFLGEGKGKNSQAHYAAVVGDTVGDPMKDTSGPSINTLLKVVAIISVVFVPVFPHEGYLEQFISGEGIN